MSVGGKVTEVIDAGDRVWVNTVESDHHHTACAIYVERTPEALAVSQGDIVWWQGGRAFWTAKDRNGKTVGKPEVVLKRIGYSGVSRPATAGDYARANTEAKP